ncbi:MAG: hypothetical protein HZA49_02420 [Planctomycetes bacterium]|nr:hypothetical protein [Planctomycetota bacterium]
MLNILSYRILDNNTRRTEEQQILSGLKEARIREKILSAARAHGENVKDDLEQAKSQVTDLTKRIPRGDNLSFYSFCILYTLCVLLFVYVYRSTHPYLMMAWDSLDNWYLQRFRPGGVQIYQVGYFIASSIWFPVLAVLLLILLWRIQKRLQYSRARRLIAIITILGAIAGLILFFGLFQLISSPLTRGGP